MRILPSQFPGSRPGHPAGLPGDGLRGKAALATGPYSAITNHSRDRLGLSRLTTPDLSWTRVTDEGVRYLERMPQVLFLNVRHTRITPEGRDRLERSRSKSRPGG